MKVLTGIISVTMVVGLGFFAAASMRLVYERENPMGSS